jgi:hypothetical protein
VRAKDMYYGTDRLASHAEVSVSDTTRLPLRLTIALLLIMVTQASLGLTWWTAYRDDDWIRAAWFGNDWVTLVVAAPLLFRAVIRAGDGSIRHRLLWLGLVGYAVYNYAFYLFGAALNIFFLRRCAGSGSGGADPSATMH